MIVTDLKRKGKSEVYKMFLDGSFYCLMEAEIIVKHNIKINQDIDENILKEYKKESDALLCKTMALNYVSKSLKTEFQVKNYLKKYKFEDSEIFQAIQKLKEYKYLDDEYYAKLSSTSLSKNKGKRYIKNELRKKGINEKAITLALQDIQNEEESCFMLAEKWLKNKQMPLPNKDKEKIYRYLLSRGYEYETIKCTLKKIGTMEFDDENWN